MSPVTPHLGRGPAGSDLIDADPEGLGRLVAGIHEGGAAQCLVHRPAVGVVIAVAAIALVASHLKTPPLSLPDGSW
jgi:hypothetical protein